MSKNKNTKVGYEIAEKLYNKANELRDNREYRKEDVVFLEQMASELQAFLWTVDRLETEVKLLDQMLKQTEEVLINLKSLVKTT